MSRLGKARTFVTIPGTPAVTSRPAEVQCPPAPAGRAYVIRNGAYVLAAINYPSLPGGTTPPACRVVQINGASYLVCDTPFPTIIPIGGT